MLRFFIILIVVLLSFAACSRSGNPVTVDDENAPLYETTQESENFTETGPNGATAYNEETQIWGAVDVVWNPSTGEASMVTRTAELALRHYKVSYFLTSPWCEDCIDIELLSSDAELGVGDFKVTLTNPTSLWAYDVRGMLQIPLETSLSFLNADGYTDLFQRPEYQYPAPFRTFARSQENHGFMPGISFTEIFSLKTVPGSTPVGFSFLVTAGHPDAAGDVSALWDFNQSGQLLPSGASTTLQCKILDLQEDIGGVSVDTSPIGGGTVWMSPAGSVWEAQVSNYGVSPGIYYLEVEAHSPNYQNAVTSHYFRAVVFPDMQAERYELLTAVNADRAAHGLQPLSLNNQLNSVAQYHAQDMSDKGFFNHVNLDGWSPWERMDYFGIDYACGGENIAVGQDSPTEVETAWMNSDGHRANILNGNFNEVGLGIVSIEPGDQYYPGYYWVQVFTN